MGIATSWVTERIAASKGLLTQTPTQFTKQLSVDKGGVLALIPSLIQQGLLSYKEYYAAIKKGYYDLQFMILMIALMYLMRIKNIEQLKQHKSGEFGRLMGLDRVPEAKCVRKKIKQITAQQKAQQWNQHLAKNWIGKQDEPHIYYIDGHVKVYNGYKARLGKKYIARQKLCMPGISEFWVNDFKGLPLLVVTGEVNEKLIEMIEKKLLKEVKQLSYTDELKAQMEQDPDHPLCILVFDREASSPAFFKWLWEEHRVAVISYKKNVKDKWEEGDFSLQKIKIEEREVSMQLAEKQVELEGMQMREIRKLSETHHQTSIVTTYRKMETIRLAFYMFSRWSQENFFWYMRQDYALDAMPEYTVDKVNEESKVVNPMYSKITYRLKKIREKINRRKARLYELENQNAKKDGLPDKKNVEKQAKLNEELIELEDDKLKQTTDRKQHPYHIKIKDMPEDYRYNKLNDEAKHFQNIIKMICYRADTSFGELLTVNYKKKQNEMHNFVKQVINTKADIIPDYKHKTLTVRLYSLATPRDNKAVREILETLNNSNTQYPGTELTLKYEMMSN